MSSLVFGVVGWFLQQQGRRGSFSAFTFLSISHTHLLFAPPSRHAVLHTPRLNTGLLPRIPPVGYTDRTNPFSPNAPCSLDPLTISLYNKPIIHKSIRGPQLHPYQVFPYNTTQASVLSCGFLSLLTNNTLRFASRLPHILMTALELSHHPSICPHLFHPHMNQFVIIILSFSISPSPPHISSAQRPPWLNSGATPHTSLEELTD